ncbi:MAG TPA: hypothetical protein H9831_13600 [Candidatus Eisenbergiella pullistercoris]|uniref:Uncharacterized protein n=1 Tax=Candidatus Eisenbergiella pullistercoris TaxID=2838555 RepID=A0A9D2C6X4_9FIRM|nr:hypothetical protein [Candidatus Eisenbergiella pullistercoris]
MIKNKFMKRVLTTALALSLVMAPVVGVSASSGSSSPVSGNSASGTASSTSVSTAEAVEIPTTSSVTVNGQVLTTTVKGAYMSKTVPGTVVMTAADTIAANYGLEAGEQPYVRIYDINEDNSPAALTSINAAADAIGGTVVATVNVELGKLGGGKFALLAQGGAPITMVFGIPRNMVNAGYTYAMICVRPGGAVEILPDQDLDPNTVTFATTGGLGAYALVMYPAA